MGLQSRRHLVPQERNVQKQISSGCTCAEEAGIIVAGAKPLTS